MNRASGLNKVIETVETRTRSIAQCQRDVVVRGGDEGMRRGGNEARRGGGVNNPNAAPWSL